MKFGKTIILLAAFIALLAFVVIFESKGHKAEERRAKEEKLVDLAASDIQRMELKNGAEVLAFKKDDKGEWLITGPLQAKADGSEVNSLADNFASLKFERVVEAEPKDLKAYEIPGRELSLWAKGAEKPVRLLFGMENPIDKTLFAQREGEKRVVLLAGFLKTSLEKKLFDFRDKTVFKLDTTGVGAIKVKSKAASWEAVKKDESWELGEPVKALAGKSKVEALIEALSGLRAKEFVSESRTEGDIRKAGLDKPDYEVSLMMPGSNAQAVFAIRKDGDKVYASDSLVDKIVLVESSILAELDKKPGDYREKKVAVFNSWEVDRIALAGVAVPLAAVKEKEKDLDKWRLEIAAKPWADGSRIETLIRKIEGLEASEFIDAPKTLAEYGLEKPSAEVRLRIKENDGRSREVVLLVGKETPEKKQVVVKNSSLGYLFLVDSAFLQDLPKTAKDWTETEPAK